MTPGQPLNVQLFDAYAANLAALGKYVEHWPAPPDTYLCPLCHTLFGRDSLTDPDALTIEHSIPECVGGTRETATLTCKKCNNTGGSLFDAHLATRFETEEFLQGMSSNSQRAWFEVGEGRTQADLKLQAGDHPSIEICFCPHMSEAPGFKEAVRATKEAVGKPGVKMSFQLRFKYLPRNARIGMLRIAYLMMFRHFGYGYALSAGANRVRQQILCPDEEILAPATSIDLGDNYADHCNTVAVVTNPPQQRAFFVPLRLTTKARVVHKGVFMPAPDDHEASIYQRLHQAKEAGDVPRINYSTFAFDLARIADPDYALLAWETWKWAQH
jgi:hypothetical protein